MEIIHIKNLYKMKGEMKPQFELSRIYEDGSQEEAQIVPLAQAINEAKMNRRGFFGAGLTSAAAIMWLSGCRTGSTIRYSTVNEYGKTVTYTKPCGSPIPPNATCTCNCVPGSTRSYTYCQCDKVCTCLAVPVYRH
jgi:hypothetical protein